MKLANAFSSTTIALTTKGTSKHSQALSLKSGVVLVGVILLLVAGIAYAATQIQRRSVPGSVFIGQVQTTRQDILVYSKIAPSTVELTELKFGTQDITDQGFFVTPPRISFWAANGGDVPFKLKVGAVDVKVNGTPVSADILALLMGQPGEDLLPAPAHARVVDPGDPPVALELGLELHGTPQALNLKAGDGITFTALFEAELMGAPRPTPTRIAFVGEGPNGEAPTFDGIGGASAGNGERVEVGTDALGSFITTLTANPIAEGGFTPMADRDGDGDIDINDIEIVLPADGGLVPGDVFVANIFNAARGHVTFMVFKSGLQAAGAFFDVRYATVVPAPPTPARIAFTSARDGNFEIYVMGAYGTNPTRLTNNPSADDHPAWSPDGSKIAFKSGRENNAEIYVMDADGGNSINLTNNPSTDEAPTWSPDGSKLAFHSYRDGGNPEIYVMNAGGTNQTRLTTNSAPDFSPAWSPDGTKIAFYRAGDIYVMDANGTNQTNITNSRGFDSNPAWSPDGSKIAFMSNRDNQVHIFVMNADGTDQTRIALGGQPAWSTDGGKIVFVKNVPDGKLIYVMDADGSNETQLTENPSPGTPHRDEHPTWSPDDSRIAFCSSRTSGIYVIDANGADQTRLAGGLIPDWSPDGSKIAFERDDEIYVMDADGFNQTRLTDTTARDSEPSWSPDGSKIAFESDRDGNLEIYVMNADGSNQTNLTNSSRGDIEPDWGPGPVP